MQRMTAPAAVLPESIRADGSECVPVWVSRSGLMMRDLGGASTAATPGAIQDVLTSANRVLMPVDRQALAGMVRLCKQSAGHEGTARALDVTTRMQVNPRVLVLSDALSRKFWTPDGANRHSIGAWTALLGSRGDADGFTSLARTVMDGPMDLRPQRDARKAVRDAEFALRRSAHKPGPYAAMTLFNAATAVSEAWSSYERVDPLLRDKWLASGEVVRLRDVRWERGQVVARLSTPCKLKPKTVLAFTDDGQDWRGTLRSLFYDDGLCGVLSGNARTSPRWVQANKVYITAAPFIATGTESPNRTWMTSKPAPAAAGMPLPVDIAVAGAPRDGD